MYLLAAVCAPESWTYPCKPTYPFIRTFSATQYAGPPPTCTVEVKSGVVTSIINVSSNGHQGIGLFDSLPALKGTGQGDIKSTNWKTLSQSSFYQCSWLSGTLTITFWDDSNIKTAKQTGVFTGTFDGGDSLSGATGEFTFLS